MPARRPRSHHGSHAGEPRAGAALRPCPGDVTGFAGRVLLPEPGGAPGFAEARTGHLGELIVPLVTARPGPARAHACRAATVVLCLG